MGLTARLWLGVALATAALQFGCGGADRIAPPEGQVDSDGDGRPASADCDDGDARVWQAVVAYQDSDFDGFGTGTRRTVCLGSDLRGWVQSEGDCAPMDATRWRTQAGLYPDQDGDGATAPGPVEGCVGATVVGYREQAGEPDCDDNDPGASRSALAWLDTDGDGIGSGEPVTWCSGPGRNPPWVHVRLSGDCAPTDPTRHTMRPYTYLDVDGDGYTVSQVGEVCSGSTLPPGYTVTSRGADCDDVSAGRWRTVSLYVDTDGDGFGEGEAQSRCTGTLPEPGYAFSVGDCAPTDGTRWQWLSYSYRDADGDSATVEEKGVLCGADSLPLGYTTWPSGNDCDDANASIHTRWTAYPDTDGDGLGAGASVTLCGASQMPAGHSPVDTDCAPEDKSAWRMLTYQHRDVDSDGYTVPSAGTLCAGTSLPAGYATQERGPDCDDSSAAIYRLVQAYADTDADGEGAGSATQLCTDGSVPAPWSPTGNDCAAEDATRWRMLTYKHVDADGDGHTVPVTPAPVCSGATLPAPYFATASGNDCDDTSEALFRWAVLYPDRDGDGVGAPPRQVTCIGQAVPEGLSLYGDDTNDTDPGQTADAEDDELLELLLDL